MKIGALKIKNYRSLYKMDKIVLDDLTIVIGKNNQGKSNFLKAIEVAFEAIASSIGSVKYKRRLTKYDYERDFPITAKSKTQNTEIIITFELNKDESDNLYKKSKLYLQDYFNTTISIDNLSKSTVTHSKKGATIDEISASNISAFILDNISFINIHAIRTENDSLNVIDQLIQNKIQAVENDEEYIKAKELILQKEKEALKDISLSTCERLNTFLPEVTSVDIVLDEYRSRYGVSTYRRRFSVKVDDGILTDLEFKGDGIKSLSALALLNDTSSKNSKAIVAIEEPESHLHSGAIHSLNNILKDIAQNTQLIITTHNPLFINKTKVSSNIIITNNTAKSANSISEIRNELGIQASDNLINAELVILVEGESDYRIFTSILSHRSEIISTALSSKRAIIKPVGGASKIEPDLSYLKQMLCKVFVILDKDQAGREAIKSALDKNLLNNNEYYLLANTSGREIEIEDMIDPAIYSDAIKEKYFVDVLESTFRGANKWSQRLERFFGSKGKLFDEQIERDIKTIVADCVVSNVDKVIIQHYEPFIQNIVTMIESIL